MTPVSQKKVEEIMKFFRADGCVRLPDWNGCEVYSPRFNAHTCIGAPWVVFVYGDDARMSTKDECFEYLQYRIRLRDSGTNTDNAG